MNNAGYQLKLDPVLSDAWGPLHFLRGVRCVESLKDARLTKHGAAGRRHPPLDRLATDGRAVAVEAEVSPPPLTSSLEMHIYRDIPETSRRIKLVFKIFKEESC